jgi:DNA-binding transcriptional LysR family regulator
MDFRGLDLNHLIALDALLEEKSITRAGERIHLCQSATSGVLAKLREVLSDKLLVQVGHEMMLTPRAEELITPVKELLLQVQVLVDKTPGFVPKASKRKFRIVLSDYIETILIPQVARRIEREAPSVSLELLPICDTAHQLLEQGKTEFLIAPASEPSALHPSETLLEDDYVCAVWSENPLIGQSISLEQYLKMGHVGICFGENRSKSWDEVFLRRNGYMRRVEVFATSFSQMPQLLVGSMRIATMHRRLANYFQQYLPLTVRDLPVQMPHLVEKLQWHQCRDQDPGCLWFREVLRQEVASLGGARNLPYGIGSRLQERSFTDAVQ